jgi:hypothetical protein
MSASVSHRGYEILSFPAHAVTPELLYLQVGDEVTAAAANTVGGWRIILFDSDVSVHVGTNVGDAGTAMEWLDALGQAAVA